VVSARTIAAAGGVVWRQGGESIEVALVHRPRYDDWTLPKGKLRSGEATLAAAVREVREELGAEVAVSRRVATSEYDVGGLTKTVMYWAMRFVGGGFTENPEVDKVSWFTPKSALKRLTYDLDRKVLRQFALRPMAQSVVVLVRHAKAGKRSEWPGDDAARPLDPTGRLQAQRLVGLLELFRPEQVISADLTRCTQTVEPLAEHLGLPVRIDPAFNDESCIADMAPTYSALMALAKPGTVSVVCSQGYTIPALVELVAPDADALTRKGAAWVLSIVDGDVVAADYYDDPSRN
jgi:8-oxo-(d)GTP phosphatase